MVMGRPADEPAGRSVILQPGQGGIAREKGFPMLQRILLAYLGFQWRGVDDDRQPVVGGIMDRHAGADHRHGVGRPRPRRDSAMAGANAGQKRAMIAGDRPPCTRTRTM